MKNEYSNYEVKDFLQDDYFIQSVKHPTVESELFWREIVGTDIYLLDKYEIAKSFIETLYVEKEEISEDDFIELWNRINHSNHRINHKFRVRKTILYTAISGVACIIFAVGIFFYNKETSDNQDILTIASYITEETYSDKVTLTLTDEEKIEIEDNNAEIKYSTEGNIAVNTNTVSNINPEKEIKYNQLTVPLGKRSVLTLSDGTRLWVNAGTKVIYPVTFNEKKREIYVDGEVFIEVTRDPDKPFLVRSETFDVKVLGTSFNVQAYKKENTSSVVLVEGSVNIKTRDKNITLKPSEKLSIVSGETNITSVNVEEYILWKEGLYMFRSERFEIILNKLSKYYGTELKCDATSAHLICNGKIDLKEDINRVLTGLTKTVPVELIKRDNIYEFKYNP